MLQTTTCVVAMLVFTTSLGRAQVAPDTVRRVLDLHTIIEKHGAAIGPRIWPGFRPDTIPALYVIAHRAKVLVQWRHPWPDGFTALAEMSEAGVAGAGVVNLPSGKFISFNSVDSTMSPGLVLGTSIHEAFHSFQRASMREGRMFGAWENAMLVGTYPIFDAANEALFALEGRRLHQALEAPDSATASQRAREFLALREWRQGKLSSEYTEFERLAELNEGLAQYALVRGLAEVARLEGGPWNARAQTESRTESQLLDSLLSLGSRSVRRRFYATGSTMALILDRLTGSVWKEKILQENLNVQQTLAWAVGYQSGESKTESWRTRAERDLAPVLAEAKATVGRLRSRRAAQADSLLQRPGLLLTIDPTSLARGTVQWCGFDPQNTLQTGDGRTLHMRFLKVCAGTGTTGEFDQPVVQSDTTALIATVLDTASFRLSASGERLAIEEGFSREVNGLRLEASRVNLEARKATVTRRGRELVVVLLP